MAELTQNYEARICRLHRKILRGGELCSVPFKDEFGNIHYCDSASDAELAEASQAKASLARQGRLEEVVKDKNNLVKRYEQTLRNVNAHIGVSPGDSTLAEIRRTVLRALPGGGGAD